MRSGNVFEVWRWGREGSFLRPKLGWRGLDRLLTSAPSTVERSEERDLYALFNARSLDASEGFWWRTCCGGGGYDGLPSPIAPELEENERCENSNGAGSSLGDIGSGGN